MGTENNLTVKTFKKKKKKTFENCESDQNPGLAF